MLATLDESGHEMSCFFEHFGPTSFNLMARELDVHQQVHKAKLGQEAWMSRLDGIVHLQNKHATLGLPLSFSDHENGMTLRSAIYGNTLR